MHRRYFRIFNLLLISLILFTSLAPAFAQADMPVPIILLEQSTESDYKHWFTFNVRARSSAGKIVSAKLLVRFPGDPTYSVYRAGFVRRPEIGASYSWNLERWSIPPWQRVYFYWKLTDQAGNTLITPETWGEVEDQTRPWQKLSDQKVTVYYYDQPEKVANKLFSAAQDAYRRLVEATGHTPQNELHVIVYNDQKAFCAFMARGECRGWEAGVSAYGTSLMWIEPNWRDPGQVFLLKQALPHELAHTFLSEWVGTRAYGIPSWFEEGQAVNNEVEGLEQYVSMSRSLFRSDRLFPLEVMEDSRRFPNTDQGIREWYAQATSMVTFLFERWGAESLGKIMNQLEDFVPFYEALEAVTGLRIEEYEYQWRLWLQAPRKKPSR
jgi:Peptidase MA superfamily